MKNRISKFATAAVVLIAVALSIVLIDKSITPAWAIEQTIEVLEGMKVVHLAGYAKYPDRPRETFEIWAMPHSMDGSVSGNFKLVEGDNHISLANERENITYVYTRHPKWDVLYITEGLNRGCNPFLTGDLFRQLKEMGRNWKERYGRDEETGRDSVFVTFIGPPVNTAPYWKLQFDVETKLPVRGSVWYSEGYEGVPHFEYTSIEYDREIPEGFFDFDIPDGTQVVDCRMLRDLLDRDPNYGILVGQVSTYDACKKVIEKYWQAVIDRNWDDVKKIRPLAAGDSLEKLQLTYQVHEPSELVSIQGVNHLDDPGTFVEATCVVKMKDGTMGQSVLNVEIRQMPRGKVGVVAGTIGAEFDEIY